MLGAPESQKGALVDTAMKTCRACMKQISVDAIKCPYCQTYQHWYRNTHTLFVLIFLPIMLLNFYSLGTFGRPSFEDYRSQIRIELISERVVESQKVLNYRVHNDSELDWNDVSYTVIGYDQAGEVMIAESGRDYDWPLRAGGWNILSAKVSPDPAIARWEFKIEDLDRDLY